MEDGTNRLRSSQKGTARSGLSDVYSIFVCSPDTLHIRLDKDDKKTLPPRLHSDILLVLTLVCFYPMGCARPRVLLIP